MFESIQPAPPDAILGLTQAFLRDPNPHKINLGVGVYKDDQGQTPVFAVVKEAERRLLEGEATKSYLPIDGDPVFDQCIGPLLLGADHPAVVEERIATAQTPGGTGGLRVVADYLHVHHPHATVWLSDPTWPNHPSIFAAAGVPTRTYPYFDAASNALAFEAMLAGIQQAKSGDVVLLHGCCHNPTGVDPSPEQWPQIADLLAKRGLIPLLDFAYQGLGAGMEEDARGLRTLADRLPELFVCNSFSKNLGLYNERVGAASVVARTVDAARAVHSQIKISIRRNYSNPPAHGGKVAAIVLGDTELRKQWEGEVAVMRERIHAMRELFVRTLKEKNVPRDFSFLARQHGMFSFSGLTPDQVRALREKHAIYIVGSGRMNVAGMTRGNMDRLCEAIVEVLRG